MTCIETWFTERTRGGGGDLRKSCIISNLLSHPKFIWIQQQSRFKTVKDQRWGRMQCVAKIILVIIYTVTAAYKP